MKKTIMLLALLTLLASCNESSTSATLPLTSPNIDADTSPSATDALTERPEHPFPAKGVNKFHKLCEELEEAFSNGCFVVEKDGIYSTSDHQPVVEKDGIALNYQVWADFAGKADKGINADITIQVHYEDPEVLWEGIEHEHAELEIYGLSVKDDTAVWTDTLDSANNASGKLSYTYSSDDGKHELFIDGEKVFEFTYFPPDPRQIALFWGFTPLEELPEDYSREQAEKDGCLVIYKDVIQNVDVLVTPRKLDGQTVYEYGSFIRIFVENNEGITIEDYGYYNTRICQMTDYSRLANPPEEEYVTTIHDSSSTYMEDGREVNQLMSFGIDNDFYGTTIIFENLPYVK